MITIYLDNMILILFLLFFQLNFVAKNRSYLSEILLPVATQRFEKTSGSSSEILKDLMTQSRAAPPKPKPRSIYQTELI